MVIIGIRVVEVNIVLGKVAIYSCDFKSSHVIQIDMDSYHLTFLHHKLSQNLFKKTLKYILHMCIMQHMFYNPKN